MSNKNQQTSVPASATVATSSASAPQAPKGKGFDLSRAKRAAENQTTVRVTLTPGQEEVLALLDGWNANGDAMGATKGWVTIEGMVDYLTDTLKSDDLTDEQQKARDVKEASLTAAINVLRKGDKGEENTIGACEKVQKGIKGKAPLYFHRNPSALPIANLMKPLTSNE